MSAAAVVFSFPSSVLPVAAIVVAVLILGTWLLSIKLKDASVIDPLWGPAFVAVGLTAAIVGGGDPARRWLLAVLTAIWGLRLGIHLIRRKLAEPGEDRRYRAMRARDPDGFALRSLYSVYLVQGVMVLIISLPLQASAERPTALHWTIVFGLALWLIGVSFEAIGDQQLSNFKQNPENRGQVMDRGLWRYTRHPNYFGDACVWWGLWLIALTAGGTWWTVVAPLLMTLFLVKVSGAGLLEKDIGTRRPGYAEYIKRTSGFIPLPPRS